MPAAKRTLPAKPARRKRGFEPASKLVAGHLRGPLEKRGFSEARLITHWREIVGDDVAEAALPVKIRHARGSFGATLVLLTTGGRAPLLEMQKDTIRQKVNACYGYNAVSKIQITQTAPTGFAEGQVAFSAREAPKPQPTPQILSAAKAAAAPIRDDRLKDALERLARNVLTKNNH
ncbi:MAG: DUF721 domain-containing protein [Rhodobacteraceae bacterium CG17_big_fil_post_rev_8_21_14_2_50_65_11]|nr:MAG: DUF721 domain-containing protein [Rhodobacteraceae bacterium CG17_big_fil_post_rev_8_21_14_2_50_65_11]